MKLTKSKLKEMIKEELLNERVGIVKDVKKGLDILNKAAELIYSGYGNISEYKELNKAIGVVEKWYKRWK